MAMIAPRYSCFREALHGSAKMRAHRLGILPRMGLEIGICGGVSSPTHYVADRDEDTRRDQAICDHPLVVCRSSHGTSQSTLEKKLVRDQMYSYAWRKLIRFRNFRPRVQSHYCPSRIVAMLFHLHDTCRRRRPAAVWCITDARDSILGARGPLAVHQPSPVPQEVQCNLRSNGHHCNLIFNASSQPIHLHSTSPTLSSILLLIDFGRPLFRAKQATTLFFNPKIYTLRLSNFFKSPNSR
ncbi:hypothetical protein BDV97DRAFT_159628 [Delphinella strobiligena]|nr:hypothetical protein BDV97DRAFT_159628 [Delphinella strobiligena]